MQNNRASVVGAGLVGSLLSVMLARRGFVVELYERRADPRKDARTDTSRSINLALSARGLYALRQVGLDEEALQHAVPMRGRVIHDSRGEVEFQPYGLQPHECLNSLSRAWLDCRLKDAAEAAGVRIHFEHHATGLTSVAKGGAPPSNPPSV
ncbi:MAG: FAD-dependent monooxygenase, partial [Candidatus Eremiobacterota bacterium]